MRLELLNPLSEQTASPERAPKEQAGKGTKLFSHYLKNASYGSLGSQVSAEASFLSSILLDASRTEQALQARQKPPTVNPVLQEKAQEQHIEKERARSEKQTERDALSLPARSSGSSSVEEPQTKEVANNTQTASGQNFKEDGHVKKNKDKGTKPGEARAPFRSKTPSAEKGNKLSGSLPEDISEVMLSKKELLSTESLKKAEDRLPFELFKKEIEKLNGALTDRKQAKNTEALVRVALDSEKWIVRHSQPLSEQKGLAKNSEEAFDAKTAKGSEKHSAGDQKNGQGNSNSGEQLFSDSLEDLSNLFVKEGRSARIANKGFSETLQKESSLREGRRLYDQLVQKAKINLRSDGSSTASIHLRPRALGRMTLNLAVFQKQVQAQIIVETQAVKQLVMEELNYFQQELQRQGIQVEGLSVRVRDGFGAQTSAEESKGKDQALEMDGREQSGRQGFQEGFPQEEGLENEPGNKELALVLQASAEEYEASEVSQAVFIGAGLIDISV